MWAGRWLYSTSLSGTVPHALCQTPFHSLDLHDCGITASSELASCNRLTVLDLSNNELIAVPPSLPDGLTHLYVNGNPLRTNTSTLIDVLANLGALAALDIQFLNVPLIFNSHNDARCLSSNCYGPRVSAPTTCILGNASICQWQLRLYDVWDQPCHVGGVVQNLTLGMECDDGMDSCEHVAQMIDQRNGSFVATVDAGWVRSKGQVQFRFYIENEEFRPSHEDSTTWAGGNTICPSSLGDGQREQCSYDVLRTVEFVSRKDCPAHSQPDSSGYNCECAPGYKREYMANQSETVVCVRDCRGGRVNSNNTCVCPTNSYDPSKVGTLRCSPFEWSQPVSTTAVNDQCLPCPNCARCEAGTVVLREGWRLAEHATKDSVVTAFRCPYADITTNSANASCPSMVLPVTTQPLCRGNHTGELCAVCEPKFTRHANSDNRCEPCIEDSYAQAVFGVSGWLLMIFAVLVMVSFGVALWYVRQKLMALKTLIYVHIRILLGWAQVLSLLSGVLDIVYPDRARTALGAAALFVADLRGFVRLDCLGWTWYGKWFMVVFGLPTVLLLLIGLRFGWSTRQQHDFAKSEAISACFFVGMLLYPQLSSSIFSALRCRQLGPSTAVLEVDYSVYCSDPDFYPTRWIARILVIVVPVGFPVTLLGLLWRKVRVVGDVQLSAEAVHQRIAETYGVCVNDYRPDCWYYEPLDMLRKLALTGLLQFVNRGTATQVFCGCGLAFVMSGLQLRLQPYSEIEANILKTLVDAQLFLTFLLSFLLRVLPRLELQEYEPLSAEFYGWVLLLSVIGLLAAAMALTVRRIRRGDGLSSDAPLLDVAARSQASIGGSE